MVQRIAIAPVARDFPQRAVHALQPHQALLSLLQQIDLYPAPFNLGPQHFRFQPIAVREGFAPHQLVVIGPFAFRN